MAWLSFTELDKAVVVWSDWLVSVIMVSVCLPSAALSQNLPFYLGFSYLGGGVFLHSCSSKAQLLLLTLDEGYLLTATPPDLERGVAPLHPPATAQLPLLGCGVAPLGHRPWPPTWGSSSWLLLRHCSLSLGDLMKILHQGTLQAVLNGLDVLLSQKDAYPASPGESYLGSRLAS